MADHTGSTSVDAPPQALFHYLSDVGNLPKYFARMTSAEMGDGEQVRTSATMPHGGTVEGEAWFRVDESSQRIEWGCEGENDYHGHLDVTGEGSSSNLEVHISTQRIANGEVDAGITETLATIKRLVESGE